MTDSVSRLIPVLLIAGLIVLSQSLVHGRDAVFGLYYRLPMLFVMWVSVSWMLKQYVTRFVAYLLVLATLSFSVFQIFQEMNTVTVRNAERAAVFRNSDQSAVLHELSERLAPAVVLAPIEISNLIPVLTSHYSLFTQYAHYEYASDRDLAERYVLQNSLFPLPLEQTVEGDPLVFGIYAGNVFARTKILCRLHLVTTGCDKKLPDFILDQNVRTFVDAGVIDQQALLRQFGVTVVITDKKLPASIMHACKEPVSVGRYTMFTCDFRDETIAGIGS